LQHALGDRHFMHGEPLSGITSTDIHRQDSFAMLMVNLNFPFGKSTNLQRCPQEDTSDRFRQ
jgi:hypothetical protein